jgi:hypothetical protein
VRMRYQSLFLVVARACRKILKSGKHFECGRANQYYTTYKQRSQHTNKSLAACYANAAISSSKKISATKVGLDVHRAQIITPCGAFV